MGNESVALITCTGDRAHAFELCRKYEARFTVPHTWIAIDGPAAPYDLNLYRAFWRLPDACEKIVIMEDDDWYHPDWLARVTRALDDYALVGETPARYFNVRYPSYAVGDNTRSASLCSTGFRRELLDRFLECMDTWTAKWLDLRFWGEAEQLNTPRLLLDSIHTVGIKGMPGRAGLGYCHGGFLPNPDLEFTKLVEWIGESDARPYRALYDRAKMGGF